MTNSQNRPSNGGSRYSSGGGQFASPQQQQHHQQQQHQKVPQMGGGYGSNGGAMAVTTPPNGGHVKGGSARKSRNQRSPSGATYFASQSMLVFTPVKQQQKMSVTPTGQHQMSSSPPNFSHFAGSKCYEAPAPTALPRPPDHWKLPTSASNGLTTPQKLVPTPKTPPQTCGGVFSDGKSDIFSQNLKMLLNIKA